MRIPLVDLRAQHHEIASEVQDGWARVLEVGDFVLGGAVEEFERAFAAFCGVAHCTGVGNGTDALELGLRALGVGPGNEVIVPANSFIASAHAVLRAGATPKLVDVDRATLLIDPEAAEAAVTARTRAVMPVHLFGQIAPMAPVLALARRAGIAAIEDAAQSQGARQEGRPAGGFGDVAATSFYPGKNLGAYGDGGAVLTADPATEARLRALRNHGSAAKYEHPAVGFNSRLDTLQAVVLSAKLKRLAAWNARRTEAAARYDHLLAEIGEVSRPVCAPGNEHVWHLYVVRVPDAPGVLVRLQERGIGAGRHYPIPIHLHAPFESLGYRRGQFPVAEEAAGEILSLPIYPHITLEQQEAVVDALREAIE